MTPARFDVAEVRRALSSPAAVLAALGLDEGARREGSGFKVRCPVHGDRSPSCSVTSGPDGTLRAVCFACGFKGDVFHLVAAARGLDTRTDFRRVLEEAASIAGLSPSTSSAPPPPRPPPPPPPPPRYPPGEELGASWRAAVRPAEADEEARAYLVRRGLSLEVLAEADLCRVLPADRAAFDWLPAAWAARWRIAALAYTAAGRPVSLHLRAVGEADPKTRWPLGCSSAGLLFMNAEAQCVALGVRTLGLEAAWIVEGLTDWLAASADALRTGRRIAVVGGTSGSWPSLARIRWPDGLPVFIATDTDEAGERYAGEILRVLPPSLEVRRVRLDVEAAS